MANFKPYFIGKVLSETSPSFKHADLVGGSLIVTSKKDNEVRFRVLWPVYKKLEKRSLPGDLRDAFSRKAYQRASWPRALKAASMCFKYGPYRSLLEDVAACRRLPSLAAYNAATPDGRLNSDLKLATWELYELFVGTVKRAATKSWDHMRIMPFYVRILCHSMHARYACIVCMRDISMLPYLFVLREIARENISWFDRRC